MSPILVRPVREQLEHDRVIRALQAKWRRRFDVAVNAGDEKNVPVRVGTNLMYPDLVLTSGDRGRAVQGVIEVETSESVNHLEAMAQWAHLGKMRPPFYLYVPVGAVEVTRRLCAEYQIAVAEIWSYHPILDQLRFTLVHRAAQPKRAPRPEPRAVRKGGASRAAARPRRAAGTRRTSAAARSATTARETARLGTKTRRTTKTKTAATARKTTRTQKRK